MADDTAELVAPPVMFPRMTDDGYAFYDDRYRVLGGSDAWLANLRTTLSSLVLQRIASHLSAVALFSVVVSSAFAAADLGALPPPLAAAVDASSIPIFPHEVVGSFIGLLLAFRTSQSYDRFWEGRTIWDGVYTHTRSITRLSCAALVDDARGAPSSSSSTSTSTLPSTSTSASASSSPTAVPSPSDDAARVEAIVGLCAAYPYALKQHLRGERNLDELLDAARAASSCAPGAVALRRLRLASVSPNVPLAVVDSLSRTILPARERRGELLWWQLDANLESLLTLLSKAERIKATPVPLSYSRHTSRFFSVYAFTLPLALVAEDKMDLWVMPLAVTIIAWVVFATEEIGHIIEDPFGRGLTDDPDKPSTQLEVLPLGRYCADIASDAATLYRSSPRGVDIEDMPGGEDSPVLVHSAHARTARTRARRHVARPHLARPHLARPRRPPPHGSTAHLRARPTPRPARALYAQSSCSRREQLPFSFLTRARALLDDTQFDDPTRS